MHSKSTRFALAFASLAAVLGATACGGGNDEAPDQTSAKALDTSVVTAQARRRPPPPAPPPAPASDSTLALASASASGQPADGLVCGVSGDGGKVLFTSVSSTLVSNDNRPFLADIFLKDFNGNGVTRAVTTGSRSLACLGMTPDANTVVFAADAGNGVVSVLGFEGTEPALLVQNISTGQQTRVTPMRSTLSNVDSFQFAGVSDDGRRVAFIAQPTRTCNLYDCTANGPARMLIRDLATGALINLDAQVRFTTSQGFVEGNALLSPDGRTLGFSSRAAYPEVGSPSGGVLALDLASRAVRLINTDAAGNQVQLGGVRAFLSNSSKVAFFNPTATNAGPAGVYVKDLNSGALTRSPFNLPMLNSGLDAPLSFSEDGRKVAYRESNGLGGQFFNSIPRVVDVTTGAVVNAATRTDGTVGNGAVTVGALISRDGRVAAFDNNATNLLGAPPAGGGAEQRAYRKLLP